MVWLKLVPAEAVDGRVKRAFVGRCEGMPQEKFCNFACSEIESGTI